MIFDGFRALTVDADGTQLFAVAGGAGPPLVLLHGYPQTHAMWEHIAPALAKEFSVFAFDLPGYGRSDAPLAGPERYTKRRMAADIHAAMVRLGFPRYLLAGHDRGARVAYRLALDTPGAVAALAILDIVPTATVWESLSVERAMGFYHWFFLAQPVPLPETLIGHDPVDFLNRTIASWTKTGNLSAFSDAALSDYRKGFADPARLAASCMDYRAGATLDWAHDRETREAGQRIEAPVDVLWGAHFAASGGLSPIDVWRNWAIDVGGTAIDAGHFLAEENPAAVIERLLAFFRQHGTRAGDGEPLPPPTVNFHHHGCGDHEHGGDQS